MVTWKKISGDRGNGWLWNIVALASKCSLRFDQEHDFFGINWWYMIGFLRHNHYHWMNIHWSLNECPSLTNCSIHYNNINNYQSQRNISYNNIYIYIEIGKWYIDISQSIRKSLTVKQGHPRCSTNKKQTLQEVTEQVYASASCRSGSSRRIPHW